MRGLNTKEASLNNDQIKELVSKQLQFRDETFDEATKDPNWRSKNSITPNEYSEWLEWAVNHLVSRYDMEEKEAQIQLSWMELKWGVRVNTYEN